MRLEFGLQQKLAQQQVMTLQLQQAIKLLQLNHMELVAAVNNEMLENPTLEEVPGTTTQELSDSQIRLHEAQERSQAEHTEQQNGNTEHEVDWGRVLDEYSASSAFKTGTGAASRFDELPPIETTLTRSATLAEHLLWQLEMQDCTPGEERAARAIIQNLDHRGWLDVDLEAVAAEANADMDDVEGALLLVQALDPIGCGARSLGECLAIQAKVLWPEDPNFEPILTKHLRDLETRNYQAIAQALELDFDDVVEYHRMIQRLEAWPGREYSDEDPHYITPDITVVKIGDRWQILQNEDGLPRLRVSPYYRHILKNQTSTKSDKAYIKERLEAADFLIKSIYRRQRTIHNVMDCILDRQQDFFEYGPERLRPMILKDIAEDIERKTGKPIHESTVSRVTTNKYVQCPHGIFELKYFFNAGIQTTDGDGDLAGAAVKSKIKKLISGEDPKRPLSDAALVDLLAKQNIQIARRTVAKYREAMGILPSAQRKRLF